MNKIEPTFCLCGCGEYAPPGEIYIKGHYEDARQLTKYLSTEKLGFFVDPNMTMYDNKQCPTYLGIVVAEQVLSKVFKNVERMKYGNHGFDFICSNGYLVDSKSSIIGINGKWHFNIKKNKVADYFALLAFDNMDDLNPMHLWLIPGHVLNNIAGLDIYELTIPRWSQYERPIDKVIACCDSMRNSTCQ